MPPHVETLQCVLLEWLPPLPKVLPRPLSVPFFTDHPTVTTHRNAAPPENGQHLRSHASSEHRFRRSCSSWKPLLPLPPRGPPACLRDVFAPVTGSCTKLAWPGAWEVWDWCHDLHPLCPQPSPAWQLWPWPAGPGGPSQPKKKISNQVKKLITFFVCHCLCYALSNKWALYRKGS